MQCWGLLWQRGKRKLERGVCWWHARLCSVLGELSLVHSMVAREPCLSLQLTYNVVIGNLMT